MRRKRAWTVIRIGVLHLLLALPTSALALDAVATGHVIDGKTIVLQQGSTYRARLKLSFFQCFAPRSKIEHKLRDRGFGGVRVFMSADDLPRDWPAQFRPKAGSCERYAEGTWTRGTRPHKRPAAIEKLWRWR